MPRYQYACTEPACGHEFEAVQSFSDAALTTCPECEGRLRKVFSAVGVVFKGAGFYRNDSRSENGKKSAASKDAATSSSSSSDSSTGSDSSGGSTTSSTSSSSSASPGGTNSASTPSKAAAAS